MNRLLTYARGTLLFPARPCSPNPSGVFAEAAFPLASGWRGREGSGSGSGSGPRGTLAAHARSHPPAPVPPARSGLYSAGTGPGRLFRRQLPSAAEGGGGHCCVSACLGVAALVARASCATAWAPSKLGEGAAPRQGLNKGGLNGLNRSWARA